MRIAVISETSAGDKNKDIITALDGYGHEIFNIGMKKTGEAPELTYIETGLLVALSLNPKGGFCCGRTEPTDSNAQCSIPVFFAV